MSKFGRYVYAKPYLIDDFLKCSICSSFLSDPHTTFCGHTFCCDCISSWLKSKKTCPLCRADCKGTHRDLIAGKFLDRHHVICPFSSCEWTGPSDARDTHADLCEGNPKNMPPDARKELEKLEKEFDGGQQFDSDSDIESKKKDAPLFVKLLMKGVGDIRKPLGITGANVQDFTMKALEIDQPPKPKIETQKRKAKAKPKVGGTVRAKKDEGSGNSIYINPSNSKRVRRTNVQSNDDDDDMWSLKSDVSFANSCGSNAIYLSDSESPLVINKKRS